MIPAAEEIAAGPRPFWLSMEEASVAAARAAFRGALRRRFSLRHVAPLVAFVLLMAFAVILALTDLIARRLAEATIIMGAIAFMASRLAAHWRLRRAQSMPPAALKAAPTCVTADATGLSLQSAAGVRRYDYRACREAEMTGALIYLWSDGDEAAVIPARAFASVQDAAEFVAMLRARIRQESAGTG